VSIFDQWTLTPGLQQMQKVARRDRRERVATACLAGMLANKSYNDATYSGFVRSAVIAADALIAELDKQVKP
jgi:hypothetical protein